MSKDGALLCDLDTAKMTGWGQGMHLPRDVGDMAVQHRASDMPAEWRSKVAKYNTGHPEARKASWPTSLSPGRAF